MSEKNTNPHPKKNNRYNSRKKRNGYRRSTASFGTKNCSLCDKPIRDLTSAISLKETDEAVHFDCYLKDLPLQTQKRDDEKIVYLGSGTFGLVKFNRETKEKPLFEIREKTTIDEGENRSNWRTQMKKNFPWVKDSLVATVEKKSSQDDPA